MALTLAVKIKQAQIISKYEPATLTYGVKAIEDLLHELGTIGDTPPSIPPPVPRGPVALKAKNKALALKRKKKLKQGIKVKKLKQAGFADLLRGAGRGVVRAAQATGRGVVRAGTAVGQGAAAGARATWGALRRQLPTFRMGGQAFSRVPTAAETAAAGAAEEAAQAGAGAVRNLGRKMVRVPKVQIGRAAEETAARTAQEAGEGAAKTVEFAGKTVGPKAQRSAAQAGEIAAERQAARAGKGLVQRQVSGVKDTFKEMSRPGAWGNLLRRHWGKAVVPAALTLATGGNLPAALAAGIIPLPFFARGRTGLGITAGLLAPAMLGKVAPGVFQNSPTPPPAPAPQAQEQAPIIVQAPSMEIPQGPSPEMQALMMNPYQMSHNSLPSYQMVPPYAQYGYGGPT